MGKCVISVTGTGFECFRAQEECEIFPRNPVVPYGSDLTIFFKAPSSSVCRSKMQFNPSRIFWTLDKRKIDKRFCDFNSTFASVSIHNLSGRGFTGVFFRHCSSCLAGRCLHPDLPQKEETTCESSGRSCTFSKINFLLKKDLSARVIATNSFGYSANSSDVLYSKGWDIVQMDSPEDVTAESLPTGLRVTWNIKEKFSVRKEETECEMRWREKDSYTEGVPPSCKAVDGYYILSDSWRRLKCFGPYQNHTFITLDEHPHRITVAAFRNDTRLNDASIEVPAMAEEGNLPPVRNISVFVQHGCVNITWEKPRLPVSGYIIVWNSTAKNHMWQHTQNTSFSLKDKPFTLYTISLTPLYKDGPGNESTLHNCSPGSNLTAVSNVQVTGFSDKHAEIRWLPLSPSQCCAFVLNYTVFYKTYNESKFRSKYFLIVLVLCCVGLILLSMLAVMIQRKLLSKKIPDPRFSSLSVWPSDKCKNPWSLLPVPGVRDTEKILPCHVDSEIISVSPTSKLVMAAVKTLTDIQNIAARIEPMAETQNTSLAASLLNEGQRPHGDKELPLIPAPDFQTSGVSLQEYSLPPIQSPYRKQTPLSSPLESPNKPPWSDETETLLTPKLKNTTFFTSYVTLDMFEPVKHPAK
ncbi:hypothetical protein QTP86_007775 [Hemibagrus guttatus]|nr:hypothetical protein QTP86_007775 [Hemibagrus guttatus]